MKLVEECAIIMCNHLCMIAIKAYWKGGFFFEEKKKDKPNSYFVPNFIYLLFDLQRSIYFSKFIRNCIGIQ